jgi:hypothetical protein
MSKKDIKNGKFKYLSKTIHLNNNLEKDEVVAVNVSEL